MTDSHSEKVFPASARKRREAREAGRVVVSPDLLAGVFLLAVTIVLHFCGHRLLDDTANYLRGSLEQIQVRSFSEHSEWTTHLVERIRLSGQYFLVKLWPFWALCFVAMFTVFAQTRGLIHWPALKPDLNRINPAIGIKKFSLSELSQRLLTISVKLTGLSFIAWTWTINQHRLESHISLAQQTQAELDRAVTFLFALSGGLIVWGIVDFFWRRRRFEKQLQMSAREVADEQKQFALDPNVKQGAQHLREKWTSELRLNRDTDLLITDGMAESILLRYQPQTHTAPIILVRESGPTGVLLLQRCMQNRINIHESAPVHRRLFQAGESLLPADLWAEIANIYANFAPHTELMSASTEPLRSERVG